MIIRGTNIGKKENTTMNSKGFKELINNIDESDLFAMDPIDLYTVYEQGIIPKNKAIFDLLVSTDEFSDERRIGLERIKTNIEENNEGILESENSSDYILCDDEDNDNCMDSDCGISKKQDSKLKKKDKKLTKLHIMKNLKSIDSQLINAIPDAEAINTLCSNKLKKMWEAVINGDITVDDIVSECKTSGKFYNKLADTFKREYDIVSSYHVPNGFDFHKTNKNTGKIVYPQPNLMQKLCVYRLKEHRNYGNWSGTGAGKTLSFIISSREIKSHLTVVVGVNSTMKQLRDDILNAYPGNTGTVVYSYDEYKDGVEFDMKKYNYLLIPYSKFSLDNAEKILQNLTKNKIDFIVIDEVHKAKKRGEDSKESRRRECLVRLIGRAKEMNSNLYKMVMSATPVINELSEAKSLLQLLLGDELDDIKTTRTLANAIKLHQMLLVYGIRFVPKYDQELTILTSENDKNLYINGDKYLQELKDRKSLEIEKLFVNDKLIAIKDYLHKGVLIYTHYTTDFINPIMRYISNLGFKTSLYSDNVDNRESELLRFINGDADIMIASDPVNTGVDHLQEVCDTMILITLPWTNADFEQLKGRIYRQGMDDNAIVKIIIPQVIVTDVEGKKWSWDKQRYDVIKYKKTLADCVIDGVIPQKNFPSRETLYKQSIESLALWKERVNSDEFLIRENNEIDIDLYPEDVEKRKVRQKSFIQSFNNKGKHTEHSKFHNEMINNPSVFFEYHKVRRETMKDWSEIPYEYIATKIKNKERVIADFGCGENLFKNCIPNNKVYSFDHIAFDDSIIACDMANTPLSDEIIDIAVFSLSLWGSNYEDYFKEAYRLLKYDGLVYIAEPSKSYSNEEREDLINLLKKNGFTIVMFENDKWEDRGKFFYITAMKK